MFLLNKLMCLLLAGNFEINEFTIQSYEAWGSRIIKMTAKGSDRQIMMAIRHFMVILQDAF